MQVGRVWFEDGNRAALNRLVTPMAIGVDGLKTLTIENCPSDDKPNKA